MYANSEITLYELRVTNRDGVSRPIDLEKIHRVISWAAEGLRMHSVSEQGLRFRGFACLLDYEGLPPWMNSFICSLSQFFIVAGFYLHTKSSITLKACFSRMPKAISWTSLLRVTGRLGQAPPVFTFYFVFLYDLIYEKTTLYFYRITPNTFPKLCTRRYILKFL